MRTTENEQRREGKYISYSAILEKYNVSYNTSHICNFNFCSSYIIKNKIKWVKLILLIIFYWIQYIQNIIILTCNEHKNIETFCIIFLN